jgi:putative holliday junction resolvase
VRSLVRGVLTSFHQFDVDFLVTTHNHLEDLNFTVIGLDVGLKRVGIATLDKYLTSALPYQAPLRADHHAESVIMDLCQIHDSKTLVIGVPLDERNNLTVEGERILRFVRRIKRRISVDTIYIDEYDSTHEALLWLYHGKTPSRDEVVRSKTLGLRDSYAAAVILKRYLHGERTGSKEWRYTPEAKYLT